MLNQLMKGVAEAKAKAEAAKAEMKEAQAVFEAAQAKFRAAENDVDAAKDSVAEEFKKKLDAAVAKLGGRTIQIGGKTGDPLDVAADTKLYIAWRGNHIGIYGGANFGSFFTPQELGAFIDDFDAAIERGEQTFCFW